MGGAQRAKEFFLSKKSDDPFFLIDFTGRAAGLVGKAESSYAPTPLLGWQSEYYIPTP